ncbi:sulfatase family protein [Clostridium grantii]|uniref:Arylsulfatase A n=1 Tax=Clostridium grantii DSM 8605 TaxID=1121316 RepID=A0A1M5UCD6_9CLOT|nr:sulfatase-like hydrolase/transferase [Clostridium grantii]SHH60343.1 Arylsulfatase A [Clostridium grantii DSM 8605]
MKTFKRPNVLIIYTDQQRKDSIKCYGNEYAITPNLDNLAFQGVRFNNFFVQNPVCMPSRMSFLTGRFCSSLGIGTNGIPLGEDVLTINNILKPYNYHTAQIGKLHFQPHSRRDHRDPHPLYGFDTFILSDEPGCYEDAYTKWVEAIDPDMVSKVRTSLPPAAAHYGTKSFSDVPRETNEPYDFEGDEEYTHSSFVASETCEFIKNHGERKPFFAIAGFYAPHTPVNPPRRFVDMFNVDDMELPKIGEHEEVSEVLKHISDEEWKKIKAYYYAFAAHVDECVGNILNTLKEKKLDEDTIVIFTSDHGEYLGDHGRIQKGMPGHDCITNVPLIIRYPKAIKENTIVEEIVEAVDVVPTILDFCGVQIPRQIQGKTFKELVTGKKKFHKEDAFTEFFDPFGGYRSSVVRTKQYKYYIDNNGDEILYDMKKDPWELVNVVMENDYKQILLDMRKRLIKRLYEAADCSKGKTAEY